MQAKTKPILATAANPTLAGLIVVTASGSVAIPWEKCSERLARASQAEWNHAVLSPSGYGIHWPLIDADIAVGPLLRVLGGF